jgi:hypothetical protein
MPLVVAPPPRCGFFSRGHKRKWRASTWLVGSSEAKAKNVPGLARFFSYFFYRVFLTPLAEKRQKTW